MLRKQRARANARTKAHIALQEQLAAGTVAAEQCRAKVHAQRFAATVKSEQKLNAQVHAIQAQRRQQREQTVRANEELRAAIEQKRRLLDDAARRAWRAKLQRGAERAQTYATGVATVPKRIQRELERGHALLASDWELLLRMEGV